MLTWLLHALHVPLRHEAQALLQMRAIEDHTLWRSPPLDAGRLPVLLVGGLGGSSNLLGPLDDFLRRLNCDVRIAATGFGAGCGETLTRTVEDDLVRASEATSRPVVLIAHSRGGQFARAVAVRRPELVQRLVTLGSPLTRMLAVHPLIRAQVAGLAALGALGVRGLMRPSCGWGSCCADLRADLVGPFPRSVPFTSVYSRSDGIVDWRSSRDPAARHREVETTHGGLIWDPVSLHAIADELAQTMRLAA
ncbi:esterase/lipase family protein [Actinokineospora sp. HUAS TT18]|uniref:esterase/lipase family protein n=1 Tax=Actinokineospora sp. HUAS TT18 TaxID=3447451 RepID=UPI003F5203C7